MREENLISNLEALYKRFGYRRYKPACFEEYSLYQENKDFLIGKNVIAFSDLSGKLMAMRPDVTLSLIKHSDVGAGQCEKFFYNEKVYRQAAGRKDYREISQTGVEVIGDIDFAATCELTLLVCRSLSLIDGNFAVDVSHTRFTEGLISAFGNDGKTVSSYLKSKNLHDFYKLADMRKFSDKLVSAYLTAVKCGGNWKTALEKCAAIALNDEMKNAVEELTKICSALETFGYADKMCVNFSAVSNADYYNGIIFNGYLQGVPHCVLSGGRYDKLLNKLGKSGGAVGFALYLGEIERYFENGDESVDYLVIYDIKSELEAVKFAENAAKNGNSSRISTVVPQGLKYKNLCDLRSKGVAK